MTSSINTLTAPQRRLVLALIALKTAKTAPAVEKPGAVKGGKRHARADLS